jgi:hypothetical protein
MLNIAGVAEWVDAQDIKSVRRGFGKRRSEAESPFFVMLFKRSTVYIEVYQYVVLYTSDRHLYGHQLLQLDLAPFKG